VIVNGTGARIKASTNQQSFGLILTAEPYFAISVPSEMVVVENTILPATLGKIEAVDAKYELLERGKYENGVFEVVPDRTEGTARTLPGTQRRPDRRMARDRQVRNRIVGQGNDRTEERRGLSEPEGEQSQVGSDDCS
jgi:hypothetical protein